MNELNTVFHAASAVDFDTIYRTIEPGFANVCQRSLGAVYALAGKYNTEIALVHQGEADMLLVHNPGTAPEGYDPYLVPLPLAAQNNAIQDNATQNNATSLRSLLEHLMQCATANGKKLMIWGATHTDIENITATGIPFRTETDRNWSDYIYRLQDLADLPNPDYRKKRTAVNKFKNDFAGRFSYTVITPNDLPKIRSYENLWMSTRIATTGENKDLEHERTQIMAMLDNFEILGTRGAYVTIDGTIAGFTLAVPLGPDTWDMTTLKITREFSNVTPYLISEFARTLQNTATYINLEEDLGIPGLRKFKTDFHPYALVEKSMLFFD